MKAAVLTGIRQMKIVDLPKPSIKNDGDVLLKVAVVGVCGSDVHYYLAGRIGSKIVQYPYLVGHECSATVEAVGKKVKHVYKGKISEEEIKKYEEAKVMRLKYRKLLSQVKKQIKFLKGALRGKEAV